MTSGRFGLFVHANAALLEQHFGCQLFEGSLNVTVHGVPDVHQQLDNGHSALVIPRRELQGMASHLGDARAWRVELSSPKVSSRPQVWLLRRLRSTVPADVVELVSPAALVKTYGFKNGDPITLTVREG